MRGNATLVIDAPVMPGKRPGAQPAGNRVPGELPGRDADLAAMRGLPDAGKPM
jgi:hypothetical protein